MTNPVKKNVDIPQTPEKYWKRYEKGMEYLTNKQLIPKTNKAWNFYSGNQWEGMKSGGEELPFLNFIKPTIKHKVSTVSQNNMVAKYSDAEGREEEETMAIYSKLNAMFARCWEKSNMDMELWATTKDSAVTGDGIQYYGTANVEDMQRLANTSVLYGDESNQNIQQQPYIIIVQRLTVGAVRERARLNNIPESEIKRITADNDTENLVGNRDEVTNDSSSNESKVTCIIHMEKKEGIVHVTQCTRSVIFEPEHPIQVTLANGEPGRGLTLYPLVKISWEDYPNSARGISEVTQLIPNQLEINKTLARRSMIIKLTAFPRIAYDGNAITNPEALGEVGAPIEMQSGGVQSINQIISYLNPAQSNSDPKNYADDLLSNSQELSGSGETAMGNINPNRVAASAIIAIRDQAALPLNEQVAKMKTFVEDLAKLWVEIWAVYHPDGFDVAIDTTDDIGESHRTVERVTTEELDNMKPDIRIDVSQDNPWTKEAEQTALDSMLEKQHITFKEYVELAPDNSVVPKNKLMEVFRKRKLEQQEQMKQEAAGLQATYGADMQAAQKAWEAQDGNSEQAVQ